MKPDKRVDRASIIYASPFIFGAACALLAVIISVFAVSNYQREKKLMNTSLEREAATIVNLVSAGARGAQRRAFMRGEIDQDSWIQNVAQAIENSVEHPGLLALYLVDPSGVIRAHSDTTAVGKRVDDGLLAQAAALRSSDSGELGVLVGTAEAELGFYRLAAIFKPAAWMREGMNPNLRGRMGRRMAEPPMLPEKLDSIAGFGNGDFILVAELSLERYQRAVRKQLLQIVILSLVMLLVGVGGLLSLIVLQTFKGSQTRLREMRTFTDVLVSSLPVGLIATDENSIIKTCNPSAAQMLGIDRPASLGKPLAAVVDQNLYQALTRLPSGRSVHWELHSVEQFEAQRSLHLSRFEIADDRFQNLGSMLLIQDLSNVRDLENQLQRAERDAAVGKMAAGVAHELRNPLSSVKGLALLLKSKFDLDDESAQQTADLLVDEVERLNRSISELLDYARPAKLECSPLMIDDLLSRAVLLVRSDAEAGNVTIVEDYRCGTSTVDGDEDKLIQVVLNLCLNSIQAMKDGGTLTLSSSLQDGWVTIAISDTGAGISPEIKERIFEPYFTTKEEGTGLGLAMSAKIIEDHRGQIEVSSKPGHGTTVILNLPRDIV